MFKYNLNTGTQFNTYNLCCRTQYYSHIFYAEIQSQYLDKHLFLPTLRSKQFQEYYIVPFLWPGYFLCLGGILWLFLLLVCSSGWFSQPPVPLEPPMIRLEPFFLSSCDPNHDVLDLPVYSSRFCFRQLLKGKGFLSITIKFL